MRFTSFDFAVFLSVVFVVYWMLPRRFLQNAFLLAASCLFYGYVHHWFLALLAVATSANYFAGLLIERYPEHRKPVLTAAVCVTLGQLGVFKYFDFFAANFRLFAEEIGISLGPLELGVVLPVGISFYSFQSLSYTIDVYRGQLPVRRSLVDFALFVSFFPQLVAGPIERAKRLLPQLEAKRSFDLNRFFSAWPLLISGFLKKLVIADNISVYADKVFMLEHPSLLLLFAGSTAFTLQIYADFSAYTDIARASARLLGIELVENFDSPYLAVSPSDFWRRWHVSFSTWIRDYLYIPLGGSRLDSRWKTFLVLLVTFSLSGLWHGSAWHFAAWGVFHAVLLFFYRSLGFGAQWKPKHTGTLLLARVAMLLFTVLGWTIFRAPSLAWLSRALFNGVELGVSGDSLAAGLVILVWTAVFSLPFCLMGLTRDIRSERGLWARAAMSAVFVVLIFVFVRDAQQDFIYFQF